MKKKGLMTAFGLLLASCAFAQQDNIFPATGFAGIGIINPNVPLNIRSLRDSRPDGATAPGISVLRLGRNGTPNYSYPESAEFRIAHGGSNIWGSRLDLYINGATNQTDIPDQHSMSWLYNGNVGIGTTSPEQKLSVLGNILANSGSNEGGALFLENSFKTANNVAYRWALYNMTGPYGNSLQFWNYSQDYSFYGSRFTIADNGNVGIGTASPGYKLEVSGDIALPYTGKILSSTDAGNNITLHNGSGLMNFMTAGQARMTIDYAGNVGIGTPSPRAMFDVARYGGSGTLGAVLSRMPEGDGSGNGTYLGISSYETGISGYNGKTFALEHSFYGQTNSAVNFYRGGSQTGGFMTFSTNNNTERMRIDPWGNVGIGVTHPTERLTINGKIKANEIRVDGAGAPDYVFEAGYKIETLEALESYIKTNKHLPEVPSAKEFERDGIALGDMNRLLLKKIEELTLHLIEKDKELAAQKETNKAQNSAIQELAKQVKIINQKLINK